MTIKLDLAKVEGYELPSDFSGGSPCPRCGSKDTYTGYGLMGGGCGAYGWCEDCVWFGKNQESYE